jgi:hypothetical protein
MKQYIFLPNTEGEYTRQADNIRGDLLEISEGNNIQGNATILSSTDGYIKETISTEILHEFIPETSYVDQRVDAYYMSGIDTNKLVIALWEAQVEGRTEALDDIQAKRLVIKEKFPKT